MADVDERRNRAGRGVLSTDDASGSLARRTAASLAAVAAAAGLIAFAHLGAFDDSSDPFPRSVIAHTG